VIHTPFFRSLQVLQPLLFPGTPTMAVVKIHQHLHPSGQAGREKWNGRRMMRRSPAVIMLEAVAAVPTGAAATTTAAGDEKPTPFNRGEKRLAVKTEKTTLLYHPGTGSKPSVTAIADLKSPCTSPWQVVQTRESGGLLRHRR